MLNYVQFNWNTTCIINLVIFKRDGNVSRIYINVPFFYSKIMSNVLKIYSKRMGNGV